MFGHLLKSRLKKALISRDVYSRKPNGSAVFTERVVCKYDPQKCPGCQSEACFHLGLDGTGVKLGTAALGLIKSGCEVLAWQ